jgi:hypothetical protein
MLDFARGSHRAFLRHREAQRLASFILSSRNVMALATVWCQITLLTCREVHSTAGHIPTLGSTHSQVSLKGSLKSKSRGHA